MAMQEHLALLELGVQNWNRWRSENPYTTPDLSATNLSGVDLSGFNLRGANLSGAILSGVDLSGVSLRGANLSGAVLSGTNLSGANLSGVDLSGTNLSGANLSGKNLSGKNLKDAILSGAILSGANLSRVNLSGKNLSGANLSGANLSGANLSGANLKDANLKDANLKNANLKDANLKNANLSKANLSGQDLSGFNLSGTNLSGAILSKANLSGQNLSGFNLSEANLIGVDLTAVHLRGANLSKANLSKANLSGQNLSGFNLSGANLSGQDLSEFDLSGTNFSGADLSKTTALGTNFTAANFTGACLEDWNINSATKLDDIDCQYVYLKSDFQECCPSSGKFAPGEFTKLFQKALSTIDLIFRNGVDWEAFAYSFTKIQVENVGEELTIRSIEVLGDSLVLVKVNVSPETDKTKFHSDFFKGYKFARKELEPQYQARLEDKDKEIDRLFYTVNQLREKLGQVPKLMAEQPKVQQNFSAPVYGVAGNVEGDFNNYPPEQKQNLVEAAAEIKQLLNHLAQANLTTEVVTETVHQKIKHDLTFKARLQAALKAGGLEALKAIFDHPIFSIPAETIKGWLEAE